MNLKILLTEEIDQSGKQYLLDQGYEIKMGTGIDEATVIKEVAGCSAILTRNAKITEKVLASEPMLKVISMHGVGVDNIDVQAATRMGIQVTNASESNTVSVAEFTIGLMIAISRNIRVYDKELRDGNWGIRRMLGFDLSGKTLGLVGMGSIGTQVARKAALGLGMKVIAYKRSPVKEHIEGVEITTDLNKVIESADFLSLHVPSNAQTRGLIGKKELAKMKKSAFLINTARGEIVDQDALIEALQQNRIAGAALDVFVNEIPEKTNPLLEMDNVIVTPHAAAFTDESLARMALYSAMGVHEVLSGQKPTRAVNTIESAEIVLERAG